MGDFPTALTTYFNTFKLMVNECGKAFENSDQPKEDKIAFLCIDPGANDIDDCLAVLLAIAFYKKLYIYFATNTYNTNIHSTNRHELLHSTNLLTWLKQQKSVTIVNEGRYEAEAEAEKEGIDVAFILSGIDRDDVTWVSKYVEIAREVIHQSDMSTLITEIPSNMRGGFKLSKPVDMQQLVQWRNATDQYMEIINIGDQSKHRYLPLPRYNRLFSVKLEENPQSLKVIQITQKKAAEAAAKALKAVEEAEAAEGGSGSGGGGGGAEDGERGEVAGAVASSEAAEDGDGDVVAEAANTAEAEKAAKEADAAKKAEVRYLEGLLANIYKEFTFNVTPGSTFDTMKLSYLVDPFVVLLYHLETEITLTNSEGQNITLKSIPDRKEILKHLRLHADKAAAAIVTPRVPILDKVGEFYNRVKQNRGGGGTRRQKKKKHNGTKQKKRNSKSHKSSRRKTKSSKTKSSKTKSSKTKRSKIKRSKTKSRKV